VTVTISRDVKSDACAAQDLRGGRDNISNTVEAANEKLGWTKARISLQN